MVTEELRIGNYIRFDSNDYEIIDGIYIDIDGDVEKNKYIVSTKYLEGELINDYNPILLTTQWENNCNIKRNTILGETFERRFIDKIEIPKWIEYVHELQNWYYWHFNKRELTIKEV